MACRIIWASEEKKDEVKAVNGEWSMVNSKNWFSPFTIDHSLFTNLPFIIHRFFYLCFEGAQGALEHLAVGAFGGAFELVEGACARQAEGFESFAAGARFGRFVQRRRGRAARAFLRFLYLVFDRFALPSSRHDPANLHVNLKSRTQL
jgi:hypothetical protein